jgi:hypothetical protein
MPSRQLAVCVWASENQVALRYQDGQEVTLTESFARKSLQWWNLTPEVANG